MSEVKVWAELVPSEAVGERLSQASLLGFWWPSSSCVFTSSALYVSKDTGHFGLGSTL